MKVDVDVHGCAPRAAAGIWVTAIVPYSWIACHLVGKKKAGETLGRLVDFTTRGRKISESRAENGKIVQTRETRKTVTLMRFAIGLAVHRKTRNGRDEV